MKIDVSNPVIQAAAIVAAAELVKAVYNEKGVSPEKLAIYCSAILDEIQKNNEKQK